MKKSITSLAVAAGLLVAGVANATPTVYGFIDIAVVDTDSAGEPDLVTTSSRIGLKGAEDLGNGLKAIYKIELEIDLDDRNPTNSHGGGTAPASATTSATRDRDQYVGLKGSLGTIVFGTASSNYKQMGGTIDPFYRTGIQARSTGQQSALHSGAGEDGGRLSSIVQYTSPKAAGFSVVLNTTLHASPDETTGVGIRYTSKSLDVWVDALNGQADGGPATALAGAFDSAAKVGARFKATEQLTFGAQFENIDTVGGGDFDVTFVSATYGIDNNNILGLTWGETEDVVSGFNLGLWHVLSKLTSVYVAYNDTSDEAPGSSAADDDTFVVGLRKKF